jgi:hypothetical protein
MAESAIQASLQLGVKGLKEAGPVRAASRHILPPDSNDTQRTFETHEPVVSLSLTPVPRYTLQLVLKTHPSGDIQGMFEHV